MEGFVKKNEEMRMEWSVALPHYLCYRGSFLAGATSSFSLVGSYPTDYVKECFKLNVRDFNDELEDCRALLSDWKMVGEDIKFAKKQFEAELSK